MLTRSTITLRLLLGVLLALTVSGLAGAQDLPPAPEGPVYDGADMIDASSAEDESSEEEQEVAQEEVLVSGRRQSARQRGLVNKRQSVSGTPRGGAVGAGAGIDVDNIVTRSSINAGVFYCCGIRDASIGGCSNRKEIVTRAEINVGVGETFCGGRVIASAPPPPAVVAMGGSMDRDDIVTRASIDGGAECAECAHLALSGSIGVNEETVVAAA